MKKIYLKARAKINLGLEILNKREDNFHNIKSVFQKINLYDEIYIEKSEINKFELITNIESLNNKDNIIYKAYIMLKEKYSSINGIKVTLNKNIPMQAGLGGGSTDCASFIIGMNKLFDLNMSQNEMENIGKSLGADVVPCFYDKAVLVEGIGDRITKLDTNFMFYIVIVQPNFFSNTKDMYKLIDEKNNIIQPNISNNIIKGLEENNIKLISNNLYNVFEEVQKEKDLIKNIKEELIINGADGALLTGSGSCIYGIFKEKEIARKAYNKLKYKYKVYICTSYNINN